MLARLLICDECGTEYYFDHEMLREIMDNNDGECAECGELNYQDHGWCSVED